MTHIQCPVGQVLMMMPMALAMLGFLADAF
jgi:hypothetical protein